MGLKDLKLVFDNPQQTFRSGETVVGRLKVHLDAPEKFRSIVVNFKGEANTSWTETETVHQHGKKEKVTVHYKDHDLYFENNVRVFGGTGGLEVLPKGEHFFQYSMVLPNHLPASFEGKYGHIRYTVKGILDNPKKHNYEVVTTITILANIDLNFDPRYREPIQREDSKTFCCCCCRSGPLVVTVHIPVRGYVVGETIPLAVEVENGSSVKVRKVMCQLQQTVSYHSSSPNGCKKDVTDAVKLKFDGPVPKYDSRSWTADLRVPSVPASMLQSCSIIDVYYKLKVTAVPRGLHKNLEISFPILIGTVPFIQNSVIQQPMPAVSQSYPMPMPAYMQQPAMPMPVPTAPPSEMSGGYMALPQMGAIPAPAAPCLYNAPPTYEESMSGGGGKF